MRQSRIKISQVIADKTLQSGVSKNLAEEIAAYLLAERRVSDLSSLARDIQGMRAEAGYVEVLVSSAHSLTAEVKDQITATIKNLYPDAIEILVTEVHDPAIIGGVRLNLADIQLDLTLRARLNKLKQLTLTGNN